MTEQRNKIGYMISNHIIPAVPVPFTSQGDIHEAGQQSYVRWMSKQDVGGVALWVHTGRGLLLSKEQREKVFAAWKDALPNRLIICGAGASPGSGSFIKIKFLINISFPFYFLCLPVVLLLPKQIIMTASLLEGDGELS
ncbi:MAG: hypothetical protein PHV61_06800 [Limnochordia bacterium]|nr:hypothetical protein [Limnochordia bacterium]